MTLDVRPLAEAEIDGPEVAALLASHPAANLFYGPAWRRVVRDAFGHATDVWAARRSGELVGLFPVTRMSHPLLGTKWVAQPYQFAGGAPLALPAQDAGDADDVARALVERVADAARRARAGWVEIRHLGELGEPAWLQAAGFRDVASGLVTTLVPIRPGGAAIELGDVRRGHRRNIASALEAGLQLAETRSADDLARFRGMYLRENRDLGAPQAGRRYFEAMHRHLGEGLRLFLARLAGEVVGGILTLDDGRTCFARCAVQGSPAVRALHVGKAQIFHGMRAAAERGCTLYNLGISWVGDAGLLASKEGWRGETVPVRLAVLPIAKAGPAPGGYFEGYGLAKAVWRRLPLPLAEHLGGWVTRWVG